MRCPGAKRKMSAHRDKARIRTCALNATAIAGRPLPAHTLAWWIKRKRPQPSEIFLRAAARLGVPNVRVAQGHVRIVRLGPTRIPRKTPTVLSEVVNVQRRQRLRDRKLIDITYTNIGLHVDSLSGWRLTTHPHMYLSNAKTMGRKSATLSLTNYRVGSRQVEGRLAFLSVEAFKTNRCSCNDSSTRPRIHADSLSHWMTNISQP
jgi:hypothetical protein